MLVGHQDDLRRDMTARTQDIRWEARRLEREHPEEAQFLHQIADRLELYLREYLRD